MGERRRLQRGGITDGERHVGVGLDGRGGAHGDGGVFAGGQRARGRDDLRQRSDVVQLLDAEGGVVAGRVVIRRHVAVFLLGGVGAPGGGCAAPVEELAREVQTVVGGHRQRRLERTEHQRVLVLALIDRLAVALVGPAHGDRVAAAQGVKVAHHGDQPRAGRHRAEVADGPVLAGHQVDLLVHAEHHADVAGAGGRGVKGDVDPTVDGRLAGVQPVHLHQKLLMRRQRDGQPLGQRPVQRRCLRAHHQLPARPVDAAPAVLDAVGLWLRRAIDVDVVATGAELELDALDLERRGVVQLEGVALQDLGAAVLPPGQAARDGWRGAVTLRGPPGGLAGVACRQREHDRQQRQERQTKNSFD